jgi:hypothetical protein
MSDTGDTGGQTQATPGDGRRLTYAQIADRLGISGEAARIMVRRRGWHRILPNHPRGLTVVVVPDDALAGEDWRRVAPTVPDELATTGDTLAGQGEQPATLLAGALAALETAVMTLREQYADAKQRAEAAEQRADRAEAGRAEERGRVDKAEAGRAEERQRAEAINALLEATQEELAGQRALTDETRAEAEKAHAEAEAIRQADAERKARGLVARLRAAWRRG